MQTSIHQMKHKILNVLAIFLGLMIVNSGLNKLFNYIPVPPDLPEAVVKDNAAMMEIQWLMPLIAVAEIIGGLLLVVKRTRPMGVLVVFPVMVGVLLVHLFVMPSTLPVALIVWAILGWLIYEYRDRYLALMGK
ncbi:MAG: DoxX family membrane protein [Chitinophagaceae bacterium]|nr:DoxX family membrane protein [Chitinophagaceae bacterium]